MTMNESMKLKKMSRMKSRKYLTYRRQIEDEMGEIMKLVERQAEVIKQQLVEIFKIEEEIDMREEAVHLRRCQVRNSACLLWG